ncbi:MAG: flagellar hook-length control protein FliK [Bacillota bacterium]
MKRNGVALTFKEGQVVKAEVVKTKGSEILLKTAGTLIKAEAQAYVPEGRELNLLVELIKPGLIRLKILDNNKQIIKAEESLLAALGLKPSDELQEIVKEMVRFKLALNRENVLALQNLLRQVDFNDAAPKGNLTELAAWLKSINLEGDGKSLLKLHSLLTGKLDELEEAMLFKFINKTECGILGGYNVFGWPFGQGHLYLLTQLPKGETVSLGQSILVLRLTSQFMGELWFRIQHDNVGLQLMVICPNEAVQETIQCEGEELLKALEKSGYSNVKLNVKIQDNLSILSFIPGPLPEDINYVNLIV